MCTQTKQQEEGVDQVSSENEEDGEDQDEAMGDKYEQDEDLIKSKLVQEMLQKLQKSTNLNALGNRAPPLKEKHVSYSINPKTGKHVGKNTVVQSVKPTKAKMMRCIKRCWKQQQKKIEKTT